MLVSFFFFFKQKTAYEMRISDWSSDVCSSDLGAESQAFIDAELAGNLSQFWSDRGMHLEHFPDAVQKEFHTLAHEQNTLRVAQNSAEIGRASCRERVCQYV